MLRLSIALTVLATAANAGVVTPQYADGTTDPGWETIWISTASCIQIVALSAEADAIVNDAGGPAYRTFQTSIDGRAWDQFIAYLNGLGDASHQQYVWPALKTACQLHPEMQARTVAAALF